MSRDLNLAHPEVSLAASGVGTLTNAKLPLANKHTFDVDGAVSVKARRGSNELKVVATFADEIANLKIAGVDEFEITETSTSVTAQIFVTSIKE